MFQKSTDNGAHPDVVCEALYLGRQHTDAAHNQVNHYPTLTGLNQRLDQIQVRQGIHFQHDAGGLSLGRSLCQDLNFCQQSLVQIKRRHPHFFQARQSALNCQMDEDVFHVLGQHRVRAKVADIGVQAGRARVVISRG